jgi:hypothetical protein
MVKEFEVPKDYAYGFETDIETETFAPGLDESVIPPGCWIGA